MKNDQCPFCNAQLQTGSAFEHGIGKVYFVFCPVCHFRGPETHSLDAAVKMYDDAIDRTNNSDTIIEVVETSDPDKYKAQMNKLLAEGYRISSTSCGFVNSEQYDFCGMYQAILVK